MAYTPIDKSSDYFNTVIYSGNGGTQSITSLDFQPDFLWGKQRNVSQDHVLIDSIRGTTKQLYSSDTSAEQTNTTGVTSFNSDGFSLGSSGYFNNGSNTYVAWNWKAGTSFTNDASATGIGTIDSTGSFNNDAGFSIVTYTGSGSNPATIKHGLNIVPKVILLKKRTGASALSWKVYVEALGNTKYLILNGTEAEASDTSIWDSTTPTSSVFTVGSSDTNNTDDYVAYCFAEKQGYSKFGSYVGNGNADGTFVYTGFKPAWVMCKITNTTDDWYMFNNKMPGYNLINESLRANTNGAQNSTGQIDFTSNGFKTRTSNYAVNGGSQSYIYMAFAENPFVTSTGVPATAR